MTVTRTFDLLDWIKSKFNHSNVLNAKVDGQWKAYSAQEYFDLAHEFALGLFKLGYSKGDKIATVSHNCPEWNIIDMGMSMIGVVHVPLFTSLSSADYKHVLNHADARAVIVSDQALLDKVLPLVEELPKLEAYYTFELIDKHSNWLEIITLGRQNKQLLPKIEQIKHSISASDCATLIYTSGTTGLSKGVMLSHTNLVQNFIQASTVFRLKPGDHYLSILPLCHVGGRLGNYQTQYSGASIFYAENMGTIAANMKEIKADGFDTVPRILEKIFDNVVAKGNKLSGMKKRLFFWAVRLGLNYKLNKDSSWWYKKRLGVADKLIFSKWREALGGRIRLAGCGGAALQPRLERIFWASGIKVINMYGLTETSPIITINDQDEAGMMLGSVGGLIDGVELKIADDGEIMCRGHNVMLGYYKNDDLTNEVIDEKGWFKTGDIGELISDKFLVVKDRKSEVFKLSNGKFVAPQRIEGYIKEIDFVDQAIVIGDGMKHASAILSVSLEVLAKMGRSKQIQFNKAEELVDHPDVAQLLNIAIKGVNKKLSDFERISRVQMVADTWSPETGELSPTLKLKRKAVMTKYGYLVDQIYGKQDY